MKLLPTYRKLLFRPLFECDICGSRVHLRLTMVHSNWHLWLAAPDVAEQGLQTATSDTSLIGQPPAQPDVTVVADSPVSNSPRGVPPA